MLEKLRMRVGSCSFDNPLGDLDPFILGFMVELSWPEVFPTGLNALEMEMKAG